MKRAIVWFRQDLRLSDNEALSTALQECDEVIPVFIDDSSDVTQQQSVSSLGLASNVWLHHSLKSLQRDLHKHGSSLVFRQGIALQELQKLLVETKATHIYWNRCYEPQVIKRDENIKTKLKKQIIVTSFKGNLLFEPWEVLKKDGTPYRVFTPYWKALMKQLNLATPRSNPRDLKAPKQWPKSVGIDGLKLLPSHPIANWDKAMMSYWEVGESSAFIRFNHFLEAQTNAYKEARDFPSMDGTTLLSAHLHFGEISPLQLFNTARNHGTQNAGKEVKTGPILRQIVWREFSHHLLFYFPQTVSEPLYEKYNSFKWLENDDYLQRWQQGKTGYPMIDAGMRQLYATGYMHNRVRMITSSFLCKNLLQDWRKGEAWFRDTLVDADIANNTMGWQWVAGCGADAAPYHRIFNPLLQSQKFDKQGEYIRRWLPELAELENKNIHLPTEEQAKSLGYPQVIVDLKASRDRALQRYQELKQSFS